VLLVATNNEAGQSPSTRHGSERWSRQNIPLLMLNSDSESAPAACGLCNWKSSRTARCLSVSWGFGLCGCGVVWRLPCGAPQTWEPTDNGLSAVQPRKSSGGGPFGVQAPIFRRRSATAQDLQGSQRNGVSESRSAPTVRRQRATGDGSSLVWRSRRRIGSVDEREPNIVVTAATSSVSSASAARRTPARSWRYNTASI
jgi:hypothetical protein